MLEKMKIIIDKGHFNMTGLKKAMGSSMVGKDVRAEGIKHVVRYPCSSTLGSTWSMGFLLIVFIVLQFISGLALSMYYVADVDKAFYSVHTFIYRCVPNGWLFMYMHSNGASMIFAIMYAHIIRGVYYRAFTRTGM